MIADSRGRAWTIGPGCDRNPRIRGSRNDAGFTLIEIMIAIAILGMALFVLLDMHYNAVRVQTRLENEVRVRNLLSLAQGMSEVEIAVGTLKDAQDFGERYPNWRYAFDAQEVETDSTTASRAGGASLFPGLYDVLVTVEDPDRTRHELHYLTNIKTDTGAQTVTGTDGNTADGNAQGEPGAPSRPASGTN